ncbi:hypothetical protein DBT_0918 [Dissulfuribacter thermophilus]|uniref:Uncharacterized protein n=1 Tax=Dissulfuribacter thermophilus TaxID=1156395 RepID=A0A1B9F6K7_9BACT|nr:hypothetical protein DBT_0918 [Dissulfuribacter thermophilus]
MSTNRAYTEITPKIEVYVKPKVSPKLPLGPVLLAKTVFPSYVDETQRGLKEIIHGTLLQTGLFTAVVDLEDADDKGEYAEASTFDYALDHGIPLHLTVSVQKILEPVGESPGFCALTLKLQRSKDKVTVFYAYGEAQLTPQREKDFIFFTKAYRRAPTTVQGLITILHAMAAELR